MKCAQYWFIVQHDINSAYAKVCKKYTQKVEGKARLRLATAKQDKLVRKTETNERERGDIREIGLKLHLRRSFRAFGFVKSNKSFMKPSIHWESSRKVKTN